MLIAVAGATGRLGSHLVEVLEERGHGVVPISRTHGLDLTTGVGLERALKGVDGIIDAATSPTPDEAEATAFFTTASRNLHEAGELAGVERMLVVSIVGIDDWSDGYGKAKLAHERAALAGPVPTRILRATQFHEFVGQLLDWATDGEVGYVPAMRTQLVAARSVAEAMVNLITMPGWSAQDGPALEIGGPRPEEFIDAATLLAAKRGRPTKVELAPPEHDPYAAADRDALLPGPAAILAGPTFASWLETAEV
ncbi:SDR family oxidoreductase [Nocardioides pocheonensis]|uniref:NAD-dependent epimerase/dehydratase family protein n=1 Tax=Nocardioides pocheonensis TaxID=661485 RepID=A0A3N0GK76_9ACTN|nr:NAD(P)H-binding protein [Nocardioides pocheonensis]RNM12528.1 NAD-dependent epimerase/dehydratase family protein [Nocardioides pocheonensis]